MPLPAADLRRKAGDDVALKVCAMVDLALAALPCRERPTLSRARQISTEGLPTATLCQVWDPALPVGSVLPDACTTRLRWILAQGQGAARAGWQAQRHDLRADFLRAFGDGIRTVPPLIAVAIGPDADNTGGRSQGFVADRVLAP